MKISWNWLNDYLTCDDLTPESAADILTSIGLEVEGMEHFESLKGGLKNFFIGEVVFCEKHPNADKLSITQVNLGETIGVKKIVCGAPNVAKGQKVVVATEGAIIYLSNGESFSIKNSKIRGEESQGMICAEDELGIGNSHEGILVLDPSAEVGLLAADYFKITRDVVFEIGLTPNRTDAMYHRGVARDLAAAINARGGHCIYHPDGKLDRSQVDNKSNRTIAVELTSPNCPKLACSVLEGLTESMTPDWLKNRLLAIGESSRNLIVDVTNYILHDLGQPLHAYDLSSWNGEKLTVRELSEDAQFLALNNQEYKLKAGDLVISDEDKIVGIAGIMGSAATSVNDHTTNILLEAAYFHSTSIRQSSQRLALRTEAATKFEKGIDPNGVEYALTKAINILTQVYPQTTVGKISMVSNLDFPFYKIKLTRAKLDLYANMTIQKADVDSILNSLGIEIEESNNEFWKLGIPRFKVDVTREEDVIEEILRIYGYDRLPYPKFLKSNLSFSKEWTPSGFETFVSNALVGSGYQEIITNSISQSRYFADAEPIRLLNSMTSELDCMRLSLLPGILEVIEYNVNRDQKDLALYEIGSEYYIGSSGGYKQRKRLLIAQTGQLVSPNWQMTKGWNSSYFTLKESVEKLGKVLKLDFTYKELSHKDYAFGLEIWLGDKEIGRLGEIIWDKKLFDVKQRVFIADLDLDYLYSQKTKKKIKYSEVSKFPSVRRDLALVVDNSTPFHLLEFHAKKAIGKSLTHFTLFDVFKDVSLGEDKKSYAVRFVLSSDEKTLSDKEIDSAMSKVIAVYKKELQAEIRS